jgi:ribosomal protein L44E
MRRRVMYHADGTVRMDWHTFCKMPVHKVTRTLEQNAQPLTLGTRRAERHGFKRRAGSLRPRPSTERVKEFL